VLGYGRKPTNPSVQPDNYVVNVLVVLAALWGGAFAWLLAAARGPRRSN
jgi:hypothetical protein